MIMNVYQPGEGLKQHTDLVRFADGICIVSLGSSATLLFTCGQAPELQEHRVCFAQHWMHCRRMQVDVAKGVWRSLATS